MANKTKYRCRKCRTDLFYDIHILKHPRGHEDDAEQCEFDFLVHPLKWMKLDEYQGKILCFKCGDKLGQYIWGGRECNGAEGKRCGRHITPWVHIQKAKVDENHLNGLEIHAQLPHFDVVTASDNSTTSAS